MCFFLCSLLVCYGCVAWDSVCASGSRTTTATGHAIATIDGGTAVRRVRGNMSLDCMIKVANEGLKMSYTVRPMHDICVHDEKRYKIILDHMKTCELCDGDEILSILYQRSVEYGRKHDYGQTYISDIFCKFSLSLFRTGKVSHAAITRVLGENTSFKFKVQYYKYCVKNKLNGEVPPDDILRKFISDSWKHVLLDHIKSINNYPDRQRDKEIFISKFRAALEEYKTISPLLEEVAIEEGLGWVVDDVKTQKVIDS